MVNGAGWLATMDMIKLSGGEPANFLDVGRYGQCANERPRGSAIRRGFQDHQNLAHSYPEDPNAVKPKTDRRK